MWNQFAEALGIEVADKAQIAGRREDSVVALTFHRLASRTGDEDFYNAFQRHSLVRIISLVNIGCCAHFFGLQRLYLFFDKSLADGGR